MRLFLRTKKRYALILKNKEKIKTIDLQILCENLRNYEQCKDQIRKNTKEIREGIKARSSTFIYKYKKKVEESASEKDDSAATNNESEDGEMTEFARIAFCSSTFEVDLIKTADEEGGKGMEENFEREQEDP
ncbi:hypothetical protein L2E82_15456 [Cichorium intybus]|uniref:Uncharacterized protein n=1 Tax=Cichorium intybus TaxID=13427 RepID=A0ACB9F3S3_CICIN|nr:hypothetical protein L2E82_15456 [Cichorium intybus]